MATSMGHLDQERQGLQSTKAKALDRIMQQELSPDVKQDVSHPHHNQQL